MSDYHKVGIRLLMTSNHGQVLGALSTALLGVNAKVNQLTKGFGTLRLAIVGALGAFAGEKMLTGLTSIVEKTADLSHELTQIRKLGDFDVSAATRAAIGVTRTVRGINEKQALEVYGGLYSLLGKQDALKLTPLLSKFDVVLGNTTGNMTESIANGRYLVRAAEQIGRLTNRVTKEVDISRFEKFVDLAARVGNLTHGAVTAQTWYQMAQQGGPALSNMSDRGLGEMAILSQYMGGARAGTASMSLMQQMGGGVMFKRSAEELSRLGILKPASFTLQAAVSCSHQRHANALAPNFPIPATSSTRCSCQRWRQRASPLRSNKSLSSLPSSAARLRSAKCLI